MTMPRSSFQALGWRPVWAHLRGGKAGDRELGLWRISLEAVDAWSLRSPGNGEVQDDKGPFARLLGA